jgi:hypothetical protein
MTMHVGFGVRRRAAALLGCAALGAGALTTGVAGAAAASAAAGAARAAASVAAIPAPAAAAAPPASCPPAPKAPADDPYYKLSGLRWDPKDTITYRIDTARLASSQVAARVADVKRAFAYADRWTGLRFSYGGTESALRKPSPQVVQVEYLASTSPVVAKSYYYARPLRPPTKRELAAGLVTITLSSKTGYGAFDSSRPIASPEGRSLLFGVGVVLGLEPVSTKWRQVMDPRFSKAHYYESFQPGDRRGLWRIGAAAGCGGFEF